MTATMTTSGSTLAKAGANYSTDLNSMDAEITQFINEAESYININTRYNWTDNYAGLNADVQKILDETTSNLAAIYCINYDMSGYTSRAEALNMLNVLWDRVEKNISLLKDKEKTDFIKGA